MARCDRNETNTQRSNLFESDFKGDSGAFGAAAPLFSSRWTSERQQVPRSARRAPAPCSKGSGAFPSALVHRGAPLRRYHRGRAGVARAIAPRSNHCSWVDDCDQTRRWTVSSVGGGAGETLTWTQVLPGLIRACWEILLDAVGRT